MNSTERPKPITREARPIDRSGPRRPNPLADRCVIYATLTWAMAAGGFVYLFASAAYLPYVLPTALASCALAVAVCILSILALMRAANRHLHRRRAVASLVMGLLLPAVALTAYAFRAPLAAWVRYGGP